MKFLLPDWFLALSIRWKLQFGFFMVTMLTIVINRWVGYGELEDTIHTAKSLGVSPEIIARLNDHLSAYITASFWQSAIEFILLFMIIGVLANIFVRPIMGLCAAITNLEKGDLTTQIKNTSHDEIGTLERSFIAMQQNLNNVIRHLDQNSKLMAQSSYQVATISHEISLTNQNEQSHAAEVDNATSNLHNISNEVQRLANEASQRALETEHTAREGVSTVQLNINEMQTTVNSVNRASNEVTELKSAAQQIYDIIGTIHGIAEQTNLLALNAAIEAARAGETGRGFAVVADEVRSLASRTASSTNQISTIINQLNAKIGQVANTMEHVVESVHANQDKARVTSDVIELMAQEVTKTAQSNNHIAMASAGQIDQLGLLQNRLVTLFESFKTSAAKVETTATIGDDLYDISENMKKLLSQFTFESSNIIEKHPNDKRRMPRIDVPLRIRATQTGKILEGISADFSMTGLQLRISEEMDKQMPLTLEVFLPYENLTEYERQIPIKVQGRIVWQRPQDSSISCGIEFQNINAIQKQQLEKCFGYFKKHPYY